MQKIKKQRTAIASWEALVISKRKNLSFFTARTLHDEGLLDPWLYFLHRNEDRQQLTKNWEKIVNGPGFTAKLRAD